jgi:hypothetical protein
MEGLKKIGLAQKVASEDRSNRPSPLRGTAVYCNWATVEMAQHIESANKKLIFFIIFLLSESKSCPEWQL